MATNFKMHVLGLHIILLLNLAHSFVLLTANMDDVKKLAKKFVSESLAEQIADFIAKISTSGVNVSEENEKNMGQYRHSSGEHYFNSIPHREEAPKNKLERNKIRQRGPKYESRPETRPTRRNTLTTRHAQKNTGRMITWSNFNREINVKYRQGVQNVNKYRLSGGQSEESENSQPESKAVFKDMANVGNDDNNNNDYQINVPKIVKQVLGNHPNRPADDVKTAESVSKRIQILKERSKIHKKPKYAMAEKESDTILDSTMGYSEDIFDETPNPSRYRFDQVPSEEINKTADYTVLNETITNMSDKIILRFDESNVVRSAADLTTQKEKNEFDQYDNKNYPKSEFVATSGPVSLPKLPPEPKWEKENSKKGEKGKRKAWF